MFPASQITPGTETHRDEPLVSGDTCKHAFDEALDGLRGTDIQGALLTLARTTLAVRKSLTPEAWREVIRTTCLPHPVTALVHQDPMTHRAFTKPRGYPGDAPLLDIIYGLGDVADAAEATTPLGRRIMASSTAFPAPASALVRCRFAAERIDALAAGGSRPRALSVACGHLREAHHSVAIREGRIEEIVAFDQDELSLARVEADYGRLAVRCVPGNVLALIRGQLDLGTFDTIHSLGLFDYLSDTLARRLIRTLCACLRPGGTLLVANYAPELPDIGYMEAWMAWDLVYRDTDHLLRLAPDGPELRSRVYRIADGNLAMLEIARA